MVFMSQATDHPDVPIVDKYVRVHTYKSNMIIKPHGNFDDVSQLSYVSAEFQIGDRGITPDVDE